MTRKGLAHHFFVDEAGDATLFDRRGRVIVGREGCSRFFILGVAQLSNVDAAHAEMEKLRCELLSDPYFQDVPSMQPRGGKTALAFHAKDDLPEVRRAVFQVIASLELKFQAIVRDKLVIVEEELALRRRNSAHRYQPNVIYDGCVSRIFANMSAESEADEILFARRGKTDRIEALAAAVEEAKIGFATEEGKTADGRFAIRAASPSESAGLQVVDYCLWAVQRLFERGEERFFNSIRSSCSLVIDADDNRRSNQGELYGHGRKLEASQLPSERQQKNSVAS